MTKNNLPKRIIMLGLYSLLLCLSQSIRADALLPQDVPPPLQPWINWVLHDTQDDICPPYYNQSPQSPTKKGKAIIKKEGLEGICQWPSLMSLNVNSTQAEFSQTWQVYSAGWIALPGNAKHWPQQVQINGTAAMVADRDGVPSIFAEKGELTLQGKFHFWYTPDFLPIPATTGLINLTIKSTPVAIPELDEQGRLW